MEKIMTPKMTEKTAKTRLTSAGLDPTAHRTRVLLAVGNTAQPLSAVEILEKIRSTANINRVTVYRILDLLVEHEVLNRLDLGKHAQRFCLRGVERTEDHAHFHCTRCDRYLCIDAPLPPLAQDVLARMGLEVERVDIRLEGVCPACKKK